MYRIWIAGADEWLPGPQFGTLDSALVSANRLAANGEVAIELPTRHWHTFSESGENFLGPAHVAPAFANGSQTDLSERANAVIASPSEDDEASRGYALSIGKLRTVRRVTAARVPAARISGVHISTPHTIESEAIEASVPAEPMPLSNSQQFVVATGRERRESKRYEASKVLKDPACLINARRTKLLDISETGIKIAVPAGVRIDIAGRVTLVFAGAHGCFELETKACWSVGGQAGLQVENAATNLVGRMFMRKMIGQWIDREKRRAALRASR